MDSPITTQKHTKSSGHHLGRAMISTRCEQMGLICPSTESKMEVKAATRSNPSNPSEKRRNNEIDLCPDVLRKEISGKV